VPRFSISTSKPLLQKESYQMSLAKISDVAKTIRAAGFDEPQTTRLLTAMAHAGHVDLENGTTAVKDALQASAGGGHPRLRTPAQCAENDQALPLLRQINQMSRRFGVTALQRPDELVDPVRLQKELDSSRASTTEKIQYKTACAMIGLLV
jgi:hypothetical protein